MSDKRFTWKTEKLQHLDDDDFNSIALAVNGHFKYIKDNSG